MKLRELPFVSLVRCVVALPAAAGYDVTLFDVRFRDRAEGALADCSRDTWLQKIGARFARLPGRGLDLQYFLDRL